MRAEFERCLQVHIHLSLLNRMMDRDVGTYECIAVNEHGEARQRVHLEIAEYPEFIKRPEETIVISRHTCRLEARVVGAPQPDIKWYKDWLPLATSSRIKVSLYLIHDSKKKSHLQLVQIF